VLILSRREVEGLLDRPALIDAVADALAELSAGHASMPPRTAATVAERSSLLGVMPCYLPGAGSLGAKLVSVFPGNAGSPVPTHQALIALFDPTDGSAVAVLDGTAITAERTAAGSALATRLLARPDAGVVAILGTGVQARAHARAMPYAVAGLREIRVAGRDPARTAAFVAELTAELRRGEPDVAIRRCASYAEAIAGADVVCATTHTEEPVVRYQWVAPGTHVNSVGVHPAGREIDADTVTNAYVVVESRESALAPIPAGANDLLWPIRDGVITTDHVRAELGEIVAGTAEGRTGPEQVTLYKSVGVAAEDLAAARLVVAAAVASGAGRHVEL
jgi:ornithine cyclodeaminase